MRHLRYIGCIAALGVALVVPAIADAHGLSKSRAANAAWLALDSHATAQEDTNEIVTDVKLEASDCFRMTAHRVDCLGTFDYEALPGWEYDDGTTIELCLATVTVRYRSRWSRALSTRIHNQSCY